MGECVRLCGGVGGFVSSQCPFTELLIGAKFCVPVHRLRLIGARECDWGLLNTVELYVEFEKIS